MPLDRQPWVEGAHYVVTDSGCWEWTGRRDEKGYGLGYKVAGERRMHRAAWALEHGPIPQGSHIHHRCENPPCMNPEHLECKTHSRHLADHHQDWSSLTWDDVNAIRDLNRQGVRQSVMRERFGIAQPTLSDIIMNKTWVDADYQPGRLVVCALRECGEVFSTTRANQRFCCARHRGMANSRVPGGYADRRLDREAA